MPINFVNKIIKNIIFNIRKYNKNIHIQNKTGNINEYKSLKNFHNCARIKKTVKHNNDYQHKLTHFFIAIGLNCS